MAIEVVASSVVAHGRAGVGVAGGNLDVAQVDAGVEHRGDERVAQHVRVHASGGDVWRTGLVLGAVGWRRADPSVCRAG